LHDINHRKLIIAASILSISGLMQGYLGFGGAIISVPILVILFGPVTAVGVITPLYIFGAITILPNALKCFDWKEVAPLSISGSISIFVGLSFLVNADPITLKKIMGVFILLTTFLLILDRPYNGPRNLISSLIAGFSTGAVTGGTGIPGAPIMVMYYLSAKVPAKVQRANILITGCIFCFCVICGLALNKIYDQKIILIIIILSPIFILANRLGQHLFKIAPTSWFKIIAYGILILSGLSLLII
tara:strand:+ start:1870 stop:2604 length:735 start_codon:yes stop_codon:yes gene_type:complete